MTDAPLISDAEFDTLRLELASDTADSWREIPWQISLTKAMSVAARNNKLVAMTVRSGHPLGCTCNNGLVERAAVTGNPAIADLLRTKFVPVAVDQHIHRRLNDSEGRLFTEVVKRAGRLLDVTAQGFYVFTSSGELLAYTHTQSAAVVKQMLISALKKTDFGSPGFVSSENGVHSDFTLKVPAGVSVLDVVSKVMGGYGKPSAGRERSLQESHGRDHCWVRDDEVLTLSNGIVPDTLLNRMARFHLVDNTRGEAPMWRADQIRTAHAVLRDGRLDGSVLLGTASHRRGYDASLLGVVEARNGVLEQFDVIARGNAWGRGYFNGGAPKGQYPLAIRFSLARGTWPHDAIPPGAARTKAARYLGIPNGAA